MAEAWSDIEIEHTLNAYADMLRMENEGKYYVKADVVRRTQQSVHRSSKAIQFKFCNISAILSEMGYPYVPGFRPLENVQGRLRELVMERQDLLLDSLG